jgi:hypothetical protein
VRLVLGVTAAVFALTAGRPNVSTAVGYMPDNVVQYAEYRLDLPGDQRQKVAEFLSVFPGFKDQSTFDQKLDETFDKIVAASPATSRPTRPTSSRGSAGSSRWAAHRSPVPEDARSMLGSMGGEPLIVLTITTRRRPPTGWPASTRRS